MKNQKNHLAKRVIRLLHQGEPKTYGEVAQKLKIDTKKVREIEKRVVKKMLLRTPNETLVIKKLKTL